MTVDSMIAVAHEPRCARPRWRLGIGVVAFRGADDDTAASRVAAVVVELCAGRRDGFQAVRGAAAACFSAASVDTDAHAREAAAGAVAAVLRRLSDSRHRRPASCALLAARARTCASPPSVLARADRRAAARRHGVAARDRARRARVAEGRAVLRAAAANHVRAPPSGDDAAGRAAAAAYVQTITVAAAATGIACTLALWEPACAAHALLDAALGERHAKAVAEAFVDAAYAHAETLEQAGDDGAARRQRARARARTAGDPRRRAVAPRGALRAKVAPHGGFAAGVTEHRETTVRKLLARSIALRRDGRRRRARARASFRRSRRAGTLAPRWSYARGGRSSACRWATTAARRRALKRSRTPRAAAVRGIPPPARRL